QALIHDPGILVLDEPTTGLDPNQIIEIRNLIKEAGLEKTVILSTHILSEVEALSDRILIIHDGRIVADGTPEELKRASSEGIAVKVRLEATADADDIAGSLSGISGVTGVEDLDGSGLYLVSGGDKGLNRDIFSLAVKKNWILLEMSTQETRLEDIFKELTKN
ncbi:MAG: gliding motility-associated ABC transporter ATP-binding subunit GldA, partial [Chlorobiota bacterium]